MLNEPIAGQQIETLPADPSMVAMPQMPGADGLQGILQGMSEEEQKIFLQNMYQDYEGQGNALSGQMDQANALRNTEAPQGREAGGMYIAANPLEHLARVIGHHKGGEQQKSISEQLRELGSNKQSALSRSGKYLMNKPTTSLSE